jgi:hypothetical protein
MAIGTVTSSVVSTPIFNSLPIPTESDEVEAAKPVATTTESVTSEPTAEAMERKLCGSATLPLGLVVLAGNRRKCLLLKER